jgi:hypothetical protein
LITIRIQQAVAKQLLEGAFPLGRAFFLWLASLELEGWHAPDLAQDGQTA